MSATAKMLVTSLADFFLAAGGVMTGAMMQQGQVLWPSNAVWLLACVTGGLAFWSHVKATMAHPPPARK